MSRKLTDEQAERVLMKSAAWSDYTGGNGFRKLSSKKGGGAKRRSLGWLEKLSLRFDVDSGVPYNPNPAITT